MTYTDEGSRTIYEGYPDGDGVFSNEERDTFLNAAKDAILNELNR